MDKSLTNIQEVLHLLGEAEKLTNFGSWVWEPIKNKIVWSDHLYKILGYEIGEVEPSAEAYFDRIHPDDVEFQQAESAKTIETAKPTGPHDSRIVLPDGRIRNIRTQAVAFKTEKGELSRIVGTVMDITEQVARDSQRLEGQKMRAIATLAGGIAHDFNNALQIMNLHVNRVKKLSIDNEKLRDSVEVINKSIEHSRQLTEKLLSFSRLKITRPEVVEPTKLLEEMRPLMVSLLGEKIKFELMSDSSSRVLIDVSQFQQVIINLVTNAKEAIEGDGEVTIEVRDSVRRMNKGDSSVEIIFRDNGSGMSPEQLRQIFDPYFSTKVDHHVGLGLASVFSIVDSHHGEIEPKSQLGWGTEFLLRFPRTKERSKERPKPEIAEKLADENLTVLFVDDLADLRDAFGMFLEDEGFKVVTAENGLHAMETLEENGWPQLDLLITDQQMPEMTGIELCENLVERYPNLPSIVLTGYDKGALENLGEKGSEPLVLEKPISMQELLTRIQELLKSTRKLSA